MVQVSSGTLLALYHGVFLYLFLLVNQATRMSMVTKLLASLPPILFVSFFPYWLEGALFLKFLLTIIGFFSTFNMIDLVFLEPVQHMSFKEYMFYLSTSSRAETAVKINKDPNASGFSINYKGLARLGKAAVKCCILSVIFEGVQKWDLEQSTWRYFVAMYLIGLCLYICFNVLLDVVGLVWEFVFYMKPKELFNTPFMASSPRDFWSKRWNMFFRDFFHKLFFRNFKNKKVSYQRSILSALAIFAISGVLHEYVYWSIMGNLSGLNFLFFMVHGLATTLQVVMQTLFPALRKVPLAVALPLNTIFLILTMPLFIHPYIQSGFIRSVRLPLSVMPTLNSAMAELSTYYT